MISKTASQTNKKKSYFKPCTPVKKKEVCFTNEGSGFQFPNHILQVPHLWVLVSKPLLLMRQVISTLRNVDNVKEQDKVKLGHQRMDVITTVLTIYTLMIVSVLQTNLTIPNLNVFATYL